jgi:hypothetical protein
MEQDKAYAYQERRDRKTGCEHNQQVALNGIQVWRK